MRTLADRQHEKAKADADDRELESRSDRRRQQDARENLLKALAARLVGAKPAALERLDLDEELLAAVMLAKSIRSAPAHNRQVNVVRQHLRALGPAADALLRRLDSPSRGPAPSSTAAVARVERPEVRAWCERLKESGDAALDELLRVAPGSDRQVLRQRLRELMRVRAAGPGAPVTRAEARLYTAVDAAFALGREPAAVTASDL